MGYYIEVPENHRKAEQLVEIHKAAIIPCPAKFKDVPEGKALICVVDNGPWEAAAYCFSESEFQEFLRDFGPRQRPRKWVLMDKPLAEKLSGYSR